jgi:hypothetical protein
MKKNKISLSGTKTKKPKVKSKGKNTIDLHITIDLDTAFGKGFRLAYLENNPHGFSATTKKHKNKKKYNRKCKNKLN